MELRHLRYFVAVAEELHFGRAAERLTVAQPAVSRSILALESELGVVLFERTAQGVRLSDAGHRFLAASVSVIEQADRSAALVRERASSARLRLGYPARANETVLRHAVKILRDEFPELIIELHEPQDGRALQDLRLGALDAVFVYGSREAPGLQFQALSELEMRIAMSADHPLARQTAVPFESLADERFLMPERSVDREQWYSDLERWCGEAGFVPNIALMTFQSRSLIWNAIESSRNVIISHWSYIRDGIVERRLVHPTPIGVFSLGVRADDTRPHVRRLLVILRELRGGPCSPTQPDVRDDRTAVAQRGTSRLAASRR